ncbi:MAG: phenylalanine--tRNA ligase subunit beta [Patescibacteria group bacterium]
MKFSFKLIKKLVPQIKNKAGLVEALSMHAFEAEEAGGDVIEVTLPPNRYSDAASHWGIAKEAAAILGFKPPSFLPNANSQAPTKSPKNFKILIKENKLCPRYTAQYFSGLKVSPSPNWIQDILRDCGLRPINNVVDIMNYVMLEVGQPLHAFDADKIGGGKIIVRRAKNKEGITSIDGNKYVLTSDMLVISDAKNAMAVAGIKGGRGSEVSSKTKNIIIESANFESMNVYRTSKALNLTTDASIRFSHELNPHLAIIGLERAAELLEEIAGVHAGERYDSTNRMPSKHVIKFSIKEFNHFIGSNLEKNVALQHLSGLGFKIKGGLVEMPTLRTDIETHEDLAEEVIRIHGLNKLKSSAPLVALRPSDSDEPILLKEKIRNMLMTSGLSEVYNPSFISEKEARVSSFWPGKAIEVQNPISEFNTHLRTNLIQGLLKNVEDNFRFFKSVKIFEIGKAFQIKNASSKTMNETTYLGLVLGEGEKETFFELKGVVDDLLKGLGLTDIFMRDLGWGNDFLRNGLKIESDHSVLGYIGHYKNGVSVAELDLDKLLVLVEGELEFEPLPKYPAIVRDISVLIGIDMRIGDIIQAIQLTNQQIIRDVDLIDEYQDNKWESMQSITLRIVFQSEERTLSGEEVDKEMNKIISLIKTKFEAEVR